jgi:hypothetical protein
VITPHDRDSAVEKVLRHSSLYQQPAVTEACLDAETLAAWIDGGLAADALANAQAHASSCARCLALVGQLMRAQPIVLAKEPARLAWWLWFAPVTAAAAGVAIWFAVPAPTLVPARAKATIVESSQSATVPPDRRNAVEEPPRPVAVPAPPQAKAQIAPEPLEVKRADEATAIQEQRDANRREADRLNVAAGDVNAAATPPASPVAAPPAAAALAAAPSVAEPPPAAASPDAAARPVGDPTSAAATAEPPSAAPEPAPVAALQERTASVDAAVTSPDPSVRWRIRGATVERSADAGGSWRRVVTGASALTAVATPSSTVCWIVGRNGVVLRLTDGENFARVTAPDAADLSTVQATDALTATVTTVDGRRFATTDGGRTWTASPPQEF